MVDTIPNNLPLRAFLLAEVLAFVHRVHSYPGVTRIALVGSLTTPKRTPKDADLLVTIADDADLTALAKAGRQLKGRAQTQNAGADIFLATPSETYIGRICHWRECRPFIRLACHAGHCGQRPFLYDDLDVLTLDAALISAPPIDLWPQVISRVTVPADVESLLLQPLRAENAAI